MKLMLGGWRWSPRTVKSVIRGLIKRPGIVHLRERREVGGQPISGMLCTCSS